MSLIGSCSIFIVLTPWEFLLVHPIGKVFLSILLVFIGFGYVSLSVFLQQLFMFYIVSFLAAGTMIGLETMRFSAVERQGFMTDISSIMYTRFSFPIIVLAILLIWVIFQGIAHFMKTRRQQFSKIVNITAVLGDTEWEGNALVDTGNQLKDPITRFPVMVMEINLLKDQLSKKELEQWRHMIRSQRVEELEHMKQWKGRWSLVPFRTAGQDMKMMFTLKPDYLLIEEEGKPERVDSVLIGLEANVLSSKGDFQMIFPADALSTSKHDNA